MSEGHVVTVSEQYVVTVSGLYVVSVNEQYEVTVSEQTGAEQSAWQEVCPVQLSVTPWRCGL